MAGDQRRRGTVVVRGSRPGLGTVTHDDLDAEHPLDVLGPLFAARAARIALHDIGRRLRRAGARREEEGESERGCAHAAPNNTPR